VNLPARTNDHTFAAEVERNVLADTVRGGYINCVFIRARAAVRFPLVNMRRFPVRHNHQNFRAVQRQTARHFRIGEVIAQHHAESADFRFRHGQFIPLAESHPLFAP
jgi:hypothetical protein